MIRSIFSRLILAALQRKNYKSRSRGMRKGSWGSEWLKRKDGGSEWYQWRERDQIRLCFEGSINSLLLMERNEEKRKSEMTPSFCLSKLCLLPRT